jgi:arylsulfatase A-like enzyme
VFLSDNGGPTGRDNASINDPLRAGKGTLYEGGVRVPAFAVWPGRLKAGSIVNEMFHMTDWYSTLLALAGAKAEQRLPVDGKDVWASIADGKPSPREELLHNVEPTRGALRKGPWKIVVHARMPVESAAGAELYNIAEDPNEKTDLASRYPDKVKELLGRLNAYAREAVPPKNRE